MEQEKDQAAATEPAESAPEAAAAKATTSAVSTKKVKLRNKGQRTFMTIEGDHKKGKVKEYSEGLAKALKERHKDEFEETSDAEDETSPSRVPGAAKAAAAKQIATAPKNGAKPGGMRVGAPKK